MTTQPFTLTKKTTSDERISAWHRGWCYHDEMNHDRKQAIANCPYPSGRLRREWIAGWDYAENLEREAESQEVDEFWGAAEQVAVCGTD